MLALSFHRKAKVNGRSLDSWYKGSVESAKKGGKEVVVEGVGKVRGEVEGE